MSTLNRHIKGRSSSSNLSTHTTNFMVWVNREDKSILELSGKEPQDNEDDEVDESDEDDEEVKLVEPTQVIAKKCAFADLILTELELKRRK
jgi:hypothetical protein